jgi:hypothetical protein
MIKILIIIYYFLITCKIKNKIYIVFNHFLQILENVIHYEESFCKVYNFSRLQLRQTDLSDVSPIY